MEIFGFITLRPCLIPAGAASPEVYGVRVSPSFPLPEIMEKYYNHDVWHQNKLEAIKKNPFKYRMEQQFFVTDALSFHGSPEPPCKVLDLGCGIGDISVALAELGYAVTGIEYSEVAYNESRDITWAGTPKITFLRGDVLDAGTLVPPGQWDFVTAFNLLHCFVTDDDRKKFYAALRAMLKPGTGRFYLSTMCGMPGAQIVSRSKIDPATRIGSNGRRLHLEAKAIFAELAANGLGVEESRLHSYNSAANPGIDTRDLSILGFAK